MNVTDASKPDLPCAIIAGGTSRRFGRPKADAVLGEKTLIQHMIDRVRCQTSGPIAVNAKQAPELPDDVPVFADILTEELGPLAGLHAVLSWAQSRGQTWVLATPVDVPFFPENLVNRLNRSGSSAVAKYGDQLHPMFGIWEIQLLPKLEEAIDAGVRSVHEWVQICDAEIVDFSDAPAHAFLNINTPEHLEDAKRCLRSAQAS